MVFAHNHVLLFLSTIWDQSPFQGNLGISHGTTALWLRNRDPGIAKGPPTFQQVALRVAILVRFPSYRNHIGSGAIWLWLPELYYDNYPRDFDNNEPITTPILQLCRFLHHLHPLLRCYILDYDFDILDDECHHGPGQGHVHPDLLEPPRRLP